MQSKKKYTTLHEVALENGAHKCFSYLNKYKAQRWHQRQS